jgi:hypothetical protein
MAEYLPKFDDEITLIASGTITGGLMVTVLGATAGADSATWLGIASRDAVAGQPFGVYAEDVQRPTAAGAIAQGALIKCAANGQVTTFVVGTDTHEKLVGIALEAASGCPPPTRPGRPPSPAS